jgi:nucleotide-binding universal stress UspA family protein
MTESRTANRIVVGVDGSPSSVDALRWALRQAELTGADVDAVTAWEMQPVFGWALVVPDENSERLARTVQADCVRRVLDDTHSLGVELHRSVIQGPPAQVLPTAAEGAQLLVVGTRGHGPLVEALLGSVGQRCVHRVACPVVIVHHEEPELTEAPA